MSARADITAGEQRIVDTLREMTAERDCPPPLRVLADRLEVSRHYVRRVVRRLVDKGVLVQPWGEGPYVVGD